MTTTTDSTLELITRFENGFNERDVDALMADMTDDVVFEHVAPVESGGMGRHVGQAAVRAIWESLETHFPEFDLQIADVFACGDRAACQWTMSWSQPDGSRGFVRGADIFRVRDGKICEKLSYVSF